MATTRDYKSLPAGAGGLSLSTPTSSWGYSSYGTLTEGLGVGIAITGITFVPDVTNTSLSLDSTYEVIIELYKGSSDTLIAQVPVSYRIDTRVAHVQPIVIDLQEPLLVEGGTRIRARAASSIPLVSLTHNSIKLLYYESDSPPDNTTNFFQLF